ncbi:MAG TPA: endonuclease I [Chromatiaceae bacterium]|nr:endonuclease I [Chromatiaceae bacterium]
MRLISRIFTACMPISIFLLSLIVSACQESQGRAGRAPVVGGDNQAAAKARHGRAPDNYRDAKRLFWRELYADGGETLYCAAEFGERHGRKINVEHVFPMSWVARALHCGEREDCRHHSRRFNRIEADLHNMYPALKQVNALRSAMAFAEIRGEKHYYPWCDIEVDFRRRKVEPRDAAQGNIARAMLYMADRYDLKLFDKQRRLLRKWDRLDPPNARERERNRLIERVQGNRNPYID